jgi:hypothetical protein
MLYGPPQHTKGSWSEWAVLWLLEFTREGHRYRAELRPDVGPRDPSSGMARGFWFVSMDGNPPLRAFEASVRDEDTEEFRRHVVAAAGAGESKRRSEPAESRQGDRRPDERDEEAEDWPRHRH